MKRAAVDTGYLALVPAASIDTVSETDVLVIPGGAGSRALTSEQRVLDWVRKLHPTGRFTTSVCTGALVRGLETGDARPDGARSSA